MLKNFGFFIALLIASQVHAMVCLTNVNKVVSESGDTVQWNAGLTNLNAKKCKAIDNPEIDTVYSAIDVSLGQKIDSLKPIKGLTNDEFLVLHKKCGEDTTFKCGYVLYKWPIVNGFVEGIVTTVIWVPDKVGLFIDSTEYVQGLKNGHSRMYKSAENFVLFSDGHFEKDLLDGDVVVFEDPLFQGKM